MCSSCLRPSVREVASTWVRKGSKRKRTPRFGFQSAIIRQAAFSAQPWPAAAFGKSLEGDFRGRSTSSHALKLTCKQRAPQNLALRSETLTKMRF